MNKTIVTYEKLQNLVRANFPGQSVCSVLDKALNKMKLNHPDYYKKVYPIAQGTMSEVAIPKIEFEHIRTIIIQTS